MRALLLSIPLFVAAFASHDETAPITAVALESHAHFLASDALRGRKTGSSEALLAAGYLATALERAGLQGAGDEGGFLQRVPLAELVANGTPQVSAQAAQGAELETFAHGDHFSIYSSPARKTNQLRVVRVQDSAELPAPDPMIALEFDGSRSELKHRLAAQGVPNGEGYGLIVLHGAKTDGKPRGAYRSGGISLAEPQDGGAPPWIVARGSLLQALDEGRLSTIAFDGACELVPVEAVNVVARIPGVGTPERPELADQFVVISAHYDHLGVASSEGSSPLDANVDSDRIFNGADDDVSGVACVLEVARVLAAGEPPARGVVILLATGEEQGLLGTEFYLDHPAVSLDRTIANLNVEMIGRPDASIGGAGQVWFTGPDETNLISAFAAAGIAVARDPYPENLYYKRSDNYAFVKRGVIGQTFSTYDGHADYHAVTDEPDTLDYDHMAGASGLVLDAIRTVTSGAVDPAWAEGKGQPVPR